MKDSKSVFILLFSAVLLFAALPQTAQAVSMSEQTTIRIKGPVAIPGRVLLPGTYLMKLVSPVSNPQLVGVYRTNLTHPVALLETVPAYRVKRANRDVFVLSKATSGNPRELETWFFPGGQTGVQFVYPAKSSHPSAHPHRS